MGGTPHLLVFSLRVSVIGAGAGIHVVAFQKVMHRLAIPQGIACGKSHKVVSDRGMKCLLGKATDL